MSTQKKASLTKVRRFSRPNYSRDIKLVAVTFFSVSAGRSFKPGDKINREDFTNLVLRRFYRRRLIGPANHSWSKAVIAARLRKEEIRKMRAEGLSSVEIAEYFAKIDEKKPDNDLDKDKAEGKEKKKRGRRPKKKESESSNENGVE